MLIFYTQGKFSIIVDDYHNQLLLLYISNIRIFSKYMRIFKCKITWSDIVYNFYCIVIILLLNAILIPLRLEKGLGNIGLPLLIYKKKHPSKRIHSLLNNLFNIHCRSNIQAGCYA